MQRFIKVIIWTLASCSSATQVEVRYFKGDTSFIDLQGCNPQNFVEGLLPAFDAEESVYVPDLLAHNQDIPLAFRSFLIGYIQDKRHAKLTKPIIQESEEGVKVICTIVPLYGYYKLDTVFCCEAHERVLFLLAVDFGDFVCSMTLYVSTQEIEAPNPILSQCLRTQHLLHGDANIPLTRTRELPRFLQEGQLRFRKNINVSISEFGILSETDLEEDCSIQYVYDSEEEDFCLDTDTLMSICDRIYSTFKDAKKPGGCLVEVEIAPHPLSSKPPIRNVWRMREVMRKLFDRCGPDGRMDDQSAQRFMKYFDIHISNTSDYGYRKKNMKYGKINENIPYEIVRREGKSFQIFCPQRFEFNTPGRELVVFRASQSIIREKEWSFEIELGTFLGYIKGFNITYQISRTLDRDERVSLMIDIKEVYKKENLTDLLMYFVSECPALAAFAQRGNKEFLLEANTKVECNPSDEEHATELAEFQFIFEFGNTELGMRNIEKIRSICDGPVLTIRPLG